MDESTERYAAYEPDADGQLIVTAVEKQRARETRRSIFVNGVFALGLSDEIYAKYALFRGRVVTAELLEEVREADERYRCKEAALMLHNYRMRSRHEMETKLTAKGFSPEAVAATLALLDEYGMLNDAAFARAVVDQQLLRRPVGRRRLAEELRRHGVPKEQIEETVRGSVSDEDELRNATAAAEKKARTLRGDDPRKRERSLAAFLASRGFSWETITKVTAAYRSRPEDE